MIYTTELNFKHSLFMGTVNQISDPRTYRYKWVAF